MTTFSDLPLAYIFQVQNTTHENRKLFLIDGANSIHRCDDAGNYNYNGVIIKSVFSYTNYREILYFLLNDNFIVGGTYFKRVDGKDESFKDFIFTIQSKSNDGCMYSKPITASYKEDNNLLGNGLCNDEVYRISGVGTGIGIELKGKEIIEVRFYASLNQDDLTHIEKDVKGIIGSFNPKNKN